MKKIILNIIRSLVNMTRGQQPSTVTAAPDLLEILYERKNRAYGAYAIRRDYAHRMGRSLFYSFSFVAAIYLTPMVWHLFAPAAVEISIDDHDPRNVIHEPKKKITIIPDLPASAKPKLLKVEKVKTITHVAPKVVPNTHPEPDLRPSVADVLDTQAAVGTTTNLDGQDGTNAVVVQTNGSPDGTDTAPTVVRPEPESEVHEFVEIKAEFAGGEAKLLEFLNKSLRYPQLAKESGIQGRVYVQFVVERDGTLTDVKLVRDIGGGCGQEVIKTVHKMPKWIPAQQNGQAVRSRFTLPVFFKLAS